MHGDALTVTLATTILPPLPVRRPPPRTIVETTNESPGDGRYGCLKKVGSRYVGDLEILV
jgi:hypothetical protein